MLTYWVTRSCPKLTFWWDFGPHPWLSIGTVSWLWPLGGGSRGQGEGGKLVSSHGVAGRGAKRFWVGGGLRWELEFRARAAQRGRARLRAEVGGGAGIGKGGGAGSFPGSGEGARHIVFGGQKSRGQAFLGPQEHSPKSALVGAR
jgi:hypothetical protein